jgi:pimeloyl-ACP methyl ester carboxylesterase
MKAWKLTGMAAGGMAVLCAAGFVVLSVRNHVLSDRWFLAPQGPGRVVDMGSRGVYLTVKGRGAPVVVIEAGLGSSSAEWWHIQEELSRVTAVVTYDRAGNGWSDPGPRPRSAGSVAAELKRLLSRQGPGGPYVLVGHDIGALYSLHYAQRYPGDTAALVLVDPLTHDYGRFRKELDRAVYKNFMDRSAVIRMGQALARLGIMRAMRIIPYRDVPPDMRPLVVEQFSRTASFDTMTAEYGAGFKKSVSEVRAMPLSLRIPIVILHHNRDAYFREMMYFGMPVDEARKIQRLWAEMYGSAMRISPSASTKEAGKTIRNIHLEEPDFIVDAVSDLVARIRRDRRAAFPVDDGIQRGRYGEAGNRVARPR